MYFNKELTIFYKTLGLKFKELEFFYETSIFSSEFYFSVNFAYSQN